jgi:nitrogen regulation protein NR(I)
MPTVLVVDDEPNLRYSLTKALSTPEVSVMSAATAREGIETVVCNRPDVVILDVRLPDQSGLEAHAKIRQIDPRLPVIIITAHGTTDTAIEAMKAGAFEYLLKPIDLHHLREVVDRALELSRMSHVPAILEEEEVAGGVGDRLLGRCPAMQEVYKAIGRVAPQDVTVLIQGESGTGKELVARAIYQHSLRGQKIFLAINCAAIPDALLESELFGHERGAFTGADQRRIGKFEQATGGTIFMDEVGDMAPATQAKLLRLLQEQKFERVGGNTTIHTDARVIAATNQDLEELVVAGRFRADLLYRLNVFSIFVPPLRDRPADLPLLVDHFVSRASRELNKRVRSVSPEAMRMLEQHLWPGNVRELQSTVKFALLHATGDVITPDCLPPNVRSPGSRAREDAEDRFDLESYVRELLVRGQPDLYHHVQSVTDRLILTAVLRHTEGNQVEAARLLGISRNTLRAKMRVLGLVVERQVLPDSEHRAQ